MKQADPGRLLLWEWAILGKYSRKYTCQVFVQLFVHIFVQVFVFILEIKSQNTDYLFIKFINISIYNIIFLKIQKIIKERLIVRHEQGKWYCSIKLEQQRR